MENQRNQQGEIVDNQTANKTNEHLKIRKKKKEKKKNPQFRNSRISVLVVLVLLLQHTVLSVYVSKAGLELGVWWCWSTPVAVSGQCATGWRVVSWPASRQPPGGPASWLASGAEAW
jgi:hypothetical protein